MGRRFVDLVRARDARGTHLPDQDQRAGRNEDVVHAGPGQRHQQAGDHRTNTGAHAIGHEQYGGQADAALGFDVVVRECGAQRIQSELQHAKDARQGHHGPVRQDQPAPHHDGQQPQQLGVEADQPGTVDAVGQPAHRPLRQQAGGDGGGNEDRSLGPRSSTTARGA
ncbi:hypothetical protein G6F31_017550 [Rhizopus arrhizus]|nr:hypothetical protein G6F31_017550 [Rhizopus arrhizus]